MSRLAARREPESTRIVRVIARLNIGGPAIQAITLTHRLTKFGYATTLVRGREEPDEGSMDRLARELGVEPLLVESLRRNPGLHDFRALWSLIRIMRRQRPKIVHTHAAKGGTLGRIAALTAFPLPRHRPVLIHTYHGHSLTGYFSPRTAALYRQIEAFLARFTDRLIAVSDEVRDELVAMRVAPMSKFAVVPLGFDLSPFLVNGSARATMRAGLRTEFGIPAGAQVVTLVARLVPIKRVDRFLRLAHALRNVPDLWFLIVGDGELREELRSSAEALDLADRLVWTGFRHDMAAVYFASDLVLLTSDNEGTPVSLIEAQAAAVPVVSTRVGGTQTVVADPELLSSPDDERGLEAAARSLLLDPRRAARSAAIGRDRVLARFGIARLDAQIDQLYVSSLERAAHR